MDPANASMNGAQTAQQPISPTSAREFEAQPVQEAQVEEVKEYEVPKEVASHVQVPKEQVEIPPDLKKMGVQAPASQTPMQNSQVSSIPLPLTDDQIGTGLHAEVKSSIRWLAEWCLKQLKTIHFHLKQAGTHFMRVKDVK